MKKRIMTLVNKYPIKLVDVKVAGEEEPFVEDMEIYSKQLDKLICSGLYNVSYSGNNDKVTLHLKDKANLGRLGWTE